jgi:hypothetical protein
MWCDIFDTVVIITVLNCTPRDNGRRLGLCGTTIHLRKEANIIVTIIIRHTMSEPRSDERHVVFIRNIIRVGRGTSGENWGSKGNFWTWIILNSGKVCFCLFFFPVGLMLTIEITQSEISLFLCCFACALSAKLPVLAILIRVSLGRMLGLDILPRRHWLVLTLIRRLVTFCVSLYGSLSVSRFVVFLWAIGGNFPNSVTLVASSRVGTLVTDRLCTFYRGIVALRKFGCKSWSFIVLDKVRVLLLEPRNQGNWTASLVVGVGGD